MLGVEMHITIKTLFSKGYNKTQIARMLDIDRKTVRTVLKKLDESGTVKRKQRSSILDSFKDFIHIQVAKDLSAQRIFQDMVKDLGYEGSYDTVKRYVRKVKQRPSKAYMVLTALPGEEAQVDFGYIGTLPLQDGRRKKAWVFTMELSHSRYMYSQIVFNQGVQTFIDCHKRAFNYFGGVPENVKIDNLKAGIFEADFYEPAVQRSYAAFAAHYGFHPDPCRVYTPTDKGKVESNIKYVKNNCFKGRDFVDLQQAKKFLAEWLETICNVRIHGTIKKVPAELFREIEKEKLKPLPDEDFTLYDFARATVMPTCHISFRSNYYSVPHNYIGQQVDIMASETLLRVFYHEKEVALHQLITDDKGQHRTNKKHYPKQKNITTEELRSRYKNEMSEIGEHALIFYERFLEKQPEKYSYRSIMGILSLRKKYSDELINAACHRAYSYEALKYKTVKTICEKGLIALPLTKEQSYLNPDETSLLRPLAEYDRLWRGGV